VVTNDEIINYYDQCQVDYSVWWHLDTQMAMHYGFWDKFTKNLPDSLWRMNDELARFASITENDIVLDAGCGVGGSSIFLASKYKCQVTGISLSRQQEEYASAKAVEKKLNEKVNFLVADFTKMPFADESFDVVWAIESVCHANEKSEFLKEASRVLKKNGRLIVADFFRTMEHPKPDEIKWLKNWSDTWAVPEFEFLDNFIKKSTHSGFIKSENKNITHNILPSSKRLYYYFFPGIIGDTFFRMIGRRNKIHKANLWSTYYQYQSLKKGLWNYHFVLLKK